LNALLVSAMYNHRTGCSFKATFNSTNMLKTTPTARFQKLKIKK